MRKHLTWVIALGLMLTATASYAQGTPRQNPRAPEKVAKAGPAQRLHLQQRIRQGIRANQLTRPELKQLRERLANIRKESLRMRADGRLGPAERMKLHQDLRKMSRALFMMRHNRIKR